MVYTFYYSYLSKEYLVTVTKKRVRNVTYRFKNDSFFVSAPYYVNRSFIIKGLDKYAGKLIKKSEKLTLDNNSDEFYLFGNRYSLVNTNQVLVDSVIVSFTSREELLNRSIELLSSYIISRVRYYESIMNIPSYKIRLKSMTTRYGSNSKQTHTIVFNTILLHYSKTIIDSVIVHELAHYFVFNHSNKFYDVIYKYLPDYKRLHTCLRKGIYHD